MEDKTPLIEFRNVTKRFDSKTVLDRANLKIYEGEITTLIGKSGTGKSVLLKHIIGLLDPDEGDILLHGKSVKTMKRAEWDQYRSRISYMFQSNALFDSMTVFENVALPLRQTTNLKKKEIEDKVMTRLEQMDLEDVTDKFPSELSGGMQKRVALARALVTDPEIVLFDEPTTGQDPIRRNAILSMIAQYRKKFGFTAVIISHDIPDIFFISDRILLLWEGGISFQGTYEELTKLNHPLVDEFLESIEGFQDELTGLLSKQVFRSRYAATLGRIRDETATAVLFLVEFDLLSEALSPKVAAEVVKTLGEFINRTFGALGGFSSRQRRGKLLTILPYVEPDEAKEMLRTLGPALQESLGRMQALTQTKLGLGACFEINVSAGITEARSNEDIEDIIQRALPEQTVIARHRCEGKEVKAA